MSEKLWIKGGRIIDPANDRDETGDIFVAEGEIQEKLSNKSREEIREIEATGNIDLSTVRAVADVGPDLISIGALTHSAPALDLSLLFDFPLDATGRAGPDPGIVA